MSLDLEEEHAWLYTILYEPLQTNQTKGSEIALDIPGMPYTLNPRLFS
jgi:hypothetical protein